MNSLMGYLNLLRFQIISPMKFYIWMKFNAKDAKIYSRCSCFGLEVMQQLNINRFAFNNQKGRVDFLMGTHSKISIFKLIKVRKFLKRKDVIYFISNQSNSRLSEINKIDCIFMDSYSELSDFLFREKDSGWSFAANYFDIDHGGNQKKFFKNEGLIPIENLKEIYSEFLSFISRKFPTTPIIFIHMPKFLEKRKEFIERNNEILKIIESMVGTYPNLHSININIDALPSEIKSGRQDPYHFTDKVYENYAGLIKSRMIAGLGSMD